MRHRMGPLCDEGMVRLQYAVIAQAADDWREADRELKRREVDAWRKRKNSCEEFFLSPWFYFLTGLDGEAILNRLKQGGGGDFLRGDGIS